MKRRSEVNCKDVTNIQSSSQGRFHGVRSSNNRCRVMISDDIGGVGRVKRVKFADSKIDYPLHCSPDSSPIQNEDAKATRSDAPKTSEYAFFKKLKRDAGCIQSDSSHKEGKHLKNLNSSAGPRGRFLGSSAEITNMYECSQREFRSSLKFGKVGHVNRELFLSALDGASKKPELTNIVKHRYTDIGSPLLVRRVSPVNRELHHSPISGITKMSGTQHSDIEIFSMKRQKLRQWVAGVSLHVVNDLPTKRCDLVSMLLSRLFPEGNQDNPCRSSTYSKSNTCTEEITSTHRRDSMGIIHEAQAQSDGFSSGCWFDRSGGIIRSRWQSVGLDTLLTSHATQSHLQQGNILNTTHRRDPMGVKHGAQAQSHDFSSESWLDGSGGIIHSRWQSTGFDSPSNSYATGSQLKLGNTNPSRNTGCERSASLIRENDALLCSSFENYGLPALCHLKGLNEFQSPIESTIQREPGALLLGWDFNNAKDGQDLSVTAHDVGTNLHQVPWREDLEDLDNRFYNNKLCLSSFFLKFPQKYTSLMHFPSDNFDDCDFKRCLEDEKYPVTELQSFPQTLLYTPKYLNLVEDYNIDNTCEGSHCRLISRVFSAKHHPGLEVFFPSGLDLDLRWKCFLKMDSSEEDYSSICRASQHPHPLKEDECSKLLPYEVRDSCPNGLEYRQTTSFFTKDTLSSHNWSPFHTSFCKKMAHPLQLDNSSWARSEEEMYCSDDAREYI